MKVAPFLVFAAVLGSGLAAEELKPEVELPPSIENLDVHEKNASSSVLGQFRTSATSWLWLRTDLYLHNGVEMRALTDDEVAAGRQGVGSVDAELAAALNEGRIVTVVPPKERDFRGVFGDIERATQSYKPMEGHTHNSPKDSLPLFRLMTLVDPQFIPAWTTAATIVSDERTETSFYKALGLLEEGLKENPDSILLLNELGRFYAGKRKDYKKALPYLERVVNRSVDVRTIDPDEGEAMLNAYRWASLCYRETGQPEKQRWVAAKGLQIFHDDAILERALGEPPYILSPEGQEEWLSKEIDAHTTQGEFEHEHRD
jgi:hypothetical protein